LESLGGAVAKSSTRGARSQRHKPAYIQCTMSLAEIIEELPKLTPEERRTIYQQIERLDGEPNFEPTPEMLGAIEEGTRSAQTERMYTAEEIKDRVHRWANSSSD
jgi:hypothetical protein